MLFYAWWRICLEEGVSVLLRLRLDVAAMSTIYVYENMRELYDLLSEANCPFDSFFPQLE